MSNGVLFAASTSQEEAVKSPMATVEHLLSLVGNMTALNTLEDEARYGYGSFHIFFGKKSLTGILGKDTKKHK